MRLHHLLLPLLLIAPLTGCGRRPAAQTGRYGLPASGAVRLVATRIAETPAKVHWKWSLLGSRNWETPAVAGTEASLSGGYALNAVGKQGGCHVWELDLEGSQKDGTWSWRITVHGSNGKTARSEGTARRLKIHASTDSETGLPSDLLLAEIDDSPVRWRIPK